MHTKLSEGWGPDGAFCERCKAHAQSIPAGLFLAMRPVTLRLFLREELTDIEYFMAPHGPFFVGPVRCRGRGKRSGGLCPLKTLEACWLCTLASLPDECIVADDHPCVLAGPSVEQPSDGRPSASGVVPSLWRASVGRSRAHRHSRRWPGTSSR